VSWRLRRAGPDDEPFLEAMLLEALFVPPGVPRPGPDVLADPHLGAYVAGFGRSGDLGFVALDAETGAPIGATWVRLADPAAPGYGFVDATTPELTIAVVEGWSGRGLGAALLGALLDVVPRCSLSVDPRNPAVRLYERLGFVAVGEVGTSITMLRR
jgi:GNAT superfamily N-acetyltransferase